MLAKTENYVFMNYKDIKPSKEQQGIFDAMEEIESGKGIPHEKVIENVRKRFIVI